MSRCDKYLEMISQYIDGELPESERAALREHLDSCPECQRYFDAFTKISNAMDEVRAPAGFAASVMSAVRAAPAPAPAPAVPAGPGRRKRRLGRGTVGRAAALAACLALVVAAGVKLSVTRDGDASAAGEPVQFSVTRTEGEGDARQTDEADGACANTASAPESGSSNFAESIDAITVSDGDAVTRIVGEDEIAAIAAILEYGEAASGLPEAQADYTFEIDGTRGTAEVLVWEIDNELVCMLDGEIVWVASGTATELAKELNWISLESSQTQSGEGNTASNSGTG